MKDMRETLIPQFSGSGESLFTQSSGQTGERKPIVILFVSESACYQKFLDLFEGLAKDFEGAADFYWMSAREHGEVKQALFSNDCPFVAVIRFGKIVGIYSCPESLTGVRLNLTQWRAPNERAFLGLQSISA